MEPKYFNFFLYKSFERQPIDQSELYQSNPLSMEGTHIPTDPADRPQEWTSLKRFNASWSKGYPIYTNKFHADNFFSASITRIESWNCS